MSKTKYNKRIQRLAGIIYKIYHQKIVLGIMCKYIFKNKLNNNLIHISNESLNINFSKVISVCLSRITMLLFDRLL